MRVMFLDLGTVVGMALVAGTPKEYELQKTIEYGFDKDRCMRFAAFPRWLRARLEQYQPTIFAYERPFGRGLGATRSLWGMAGLTESVVTHYGLPCLDILPSPIKKWATGKGNADKEAMITAADNLFCRELGEHAADAALGAAYVLENVEVGT